MANLKTKLNTTAVITKKKFVNWAGHYVSCSHLYAFRHSTKYCTAMLQHVNTTQPPTRAVAADNMLLYAHLSLHLLLCEHCLMLSSCWTQSLCRAYCNYAGVCTPAAIRLAAQLLVCA